MHDATALLDAPPAGARIVARGLTTVHRNGSVALDGVEVSIEPGSVTAVIGPSGAGKTTLLAALAGVAPARSGSVSIDAPDGGPVRIGYVPQDDILHGDLPLGRTLRYAAALRMETSDPAHLDAAVDRVVRSLGLEHHTEVRVADLSGGQRKRASIACEILTRPGVCFLDEPTSGLDPSASADLVDSLRCLGDGGSTVVFTTHSVQDIERSDRVVVLAPGGRLVATGTPAQVLERTGATTFTELYERLSRERPHPSGAGSGPEPDVRGTPTRRADVPRRHGRPQRPSAVRQWLVLTRRSAEIIVRNHLTLAILIGSPAAVIAMFAVLFQPGGFDPATADATAAVMVVYWLAFAAFFFGLTYGLLQVCAEVPVLRREHHAGVRTGAYFLSKLTLLTPFLVAVNVTMLVVLRALDRIPVLPFATMAELSLTMALDAVAALCLGLLASAAVGSTAQAALALPMLCFPAVLFSGAMVPIPVMTSAGRSIAAAMSDRWAFEAIARHLDLAAVTAPGSAHAGLGASSAVTYWGLLALFSLVLGGGAWAAVHRRATGVDR